MDREGKRERETEIDMLMYADETFHPNGMPNFKQCDPK